MGMRSMGGGGHKKSGGLSPPGPQLGGLTGPPGPPFFLDIDTWADIAIKHW